MEPSLQVELSAISRMQSDYTNCSKGYWTSQGRDIEGPNANRVHSKVLLVARTVAAYRRRLPNPPDDSTPEGRRPKPTGWSTRPAPTITGCKERRSSHEGQRPTTS
ncbi:hypothetical protein AMECASPLE_037771 [Ameca splendens]|uniref:Uncharacterized protein n=1 Tax=Ameca splendens TaxID=208324 RepID=A0ABV0XL28_9TELE